MAGLYHKRLPNFETVDVIHLAVVPRYKMSEFSGNEWRTSVSIEFYFKGSLIFQVTAPDMHSALLDLGYLWSNQQSPLPQRVLEVEAELCDQPSCPRRAVKKFRLNRETAPNGEWLEKDDTVAHYRQFCLEHSKRGDCSREDCDTNYTPEGEPE